MSLLNFKIYVSLSQSTVASLQEYFPLRYWNVFVLSQLSQAMYLCPFNHIMQKCQSVDCTQLLHQIFLANIRTHWAMFITSSHKIYTKCKRRKILKIQQIFLTAENNFFVRDTKNHMLLLFKRKLQQEANYIIPVLFFHCTI